MIREYSLVHCLRSIPPSRSHNLKSGMINQTRLEDGKFSKMLDKWSNNVNESDQLWSRTFLFVSLQSLCRTIGWMHYKPNNHDPTNKKKICDSYELCKHNFLKCIIPVNSSEMIVWTHIWLTWIEFEVASERRGWLNVFTEPETTKVDHFTISNDNTYANRHISITESQNK